MLGVVETNINEHRRLSRFAVSGFRSTHKKPADSQTEEELNSSRVDENKVQEELDIIIGKRKEWDSRQEESHLFRRNMKLAKKVVEKPYFPLPPCYVTKDPLPTKVNTNFHCRVHVPTEESDMKLTVKCNGELTADDFLEFFVNKINSAYKFLKSKHDSVFKALGSCEYIHGSNKMINYEYIRSCITAGKLVELILVNRTSVFPSLDENDRAREISYDFGSMKVNLPDHEKIKYDPSKPMEDLNCLSLWDIKRPFRIRIIGADNVTRNVTNAQYEEIEQGMIYDSSQTVVYAKVDLYHGGHQITQTRFTKAAPYSRYVRWAQYLVFPELNFSELPRETKVCITVYSRKYVATDPMLFSSDGSGLVREKDVPLCYVNYPLLDHKGQLKSGGAKLRMWPDEASQPHFASVQNMGSGGLADSAAPCCITYEIDGFSLPVMFPQGEPSAEMKSKLCEYERNMRVKYPRLSEEDTRKELDRIIATDPLYQLNEEEMWRLWDARDILKNNKHALPKFLLSVPSQHPQAVFISHQLMDEWVELDPVDAIELLDYNYGDVCVRQYAVQLIEKLDDTDLSDFVLQLVQTLKYELYHESPLAKFLLHRGLNSPHQIGHILFWHLKAEMHIPYIRERFGLILEEYLINCGPYKWDLLKQCSLVDQLNMIALKIKEHRKVEHTSILRRELEKLVHPPKFKLPLSPRMEVSKPILEKCKVMGSRKCPLWLVFENADPSAPPVYVIFKAGDDIRQDLLTLQMLKTMDKRWKQEGLDLHMRPYGCVCLGDMMGMIEIVLNAETIANITAATGGATAAFSNEPLTTWLKQQNPKSDVWATVVNNFVYSCAGYCVATYILGIGDRHNDNIMLTTKGDLFHIDFGHFLGHFKKFGIYKRETTPFVFTPMYAHVMGGESSAEFRKYSKLSCQAFNIIRKHGRLIISLFLLMLATGIPELRSIENIMWLRKCLVLEKSEQEANLHFKEQIKKSLTNTRAQLNDCIHIIAHHNL